MVCIVDADPAVRDSLATLMDLDGHRVLTFGSGREALDGSRGQTIGWVICEAELPDFSGVQLYRLFKASHPDTRFALLMSRTDPAAMAVARRCGIDAVFHKPLVHRRLASFVKTT